MTDDPDPVRVVTGYGFGGAGGTDREAAGWPGHVVPAAPGCAGAPLTCGIAGRALAMR